MSQQEDDLKEQMLNEAMLIIESVGFLDKQINKVFGELQDAINNHFYEDADRIEAQIRFLLKKTNDENANMERFMLKYKEKINEKKAILSGIKQKKSLHNGSISAKQGRTPSSPTLQRQTQKREQRVAINN